MIAKILRTAFVVALPVSLLAFFNSNAASAQFSWTNWKVPVGPVGTMENDLEHELIAANNLGLISLLEYAQFSRDLDGIRVQEESYRSSIGGMSGSREARLMDKLDLLKAELYAHKSASHAVADVVVATPY